jgi:hypothetical protein
MAGLAALLFSTLGTTAMRSVHVNWCNSRHSLEHSP